MRKYFSKRIDELPVDALTKATLSQEETQQKHVFYLSLIDYIFPLYEHISVAQKEQVAFSGYLYFRFLLEFDDFMDTSAHKEKLAQISQLKRTMELHEAAIRELASLFPTDSPFWWQFNRYKDEYARAVLGEKQFSQTKQPYTERTYEQLAASKSAVCYVAVLALSVLNGGTVYDDQLEKCLRHIHIAFQYLDDIADFKIDIDQNQWTYAHQLVEEYLTKHCIETVDKNLLHKYLYLSTVAEGSISKAAYHYQVAIDLANELKLVELSIYLLKQKGLASSFRDEVQLLMQKARLKATQSTVIRPRPTAPQAFESALAWLTNARTNDLWSDFMTSAGSGDTWISAYAGFMLAECDVDRQSLFSTLRKLSTTGSFNETIVQDGDSTNFLVGLHWRLNQSIPLELQQNWLAFRKSNGGWTTYREEYQLRRRMDLPDQTSMAGWLADHDCVTAAAAYILSDIPALVPVYDSTCQYLATRLISGNLQSYWWTSDIYTLSFTALAFARSELYSLYGPQLTHQIAQQQCAGGCWNNPACDQPSAFYTAIALKALMAVAPGEFTGAVERGVQWLLANQMEDGSWQTNRILRIPATDVLKPSRVPHWRQSSFGVNTLVDDHNRVFTTSTVLNALGCFLAINNERSCLSHQEPVFTSSTEAIGLFTQPKGVTS